MNRKSHFVFCTAALIAASATAHAATLELTADTYLDSYPGGIFPPATQSVPENDDYNYGNTGGIKAVVSNGSTDFPGPSTVHSVFQLPALFWSAVGNSPVTSATVTLVIRNNNSGIGVDGSGEQAVLAPLTQSYVAGLGGIPSQTKGGGTKNTAANPIGADWFTTDGINTWTTPGGSYDAADTVSVRDLSTSVSLTWDITSLINNVGTSTDTRSLIKNNGLLLKLSNDALVQPVNQQQFISFYSSEATPPNGDGSLVANAPVVNFTVAPEPASLGILSLGIAGLLVRRKS